MKRLIITVLVALVGLTVKAQEFNLGLSAARPSTENDLFDSTFILDAEYLHEVSERIKLGATTGYLYSTGQSYAGFVPLAASLRFKATEKLSFGTDIGYAFSDRLSNPLGGFYFALKAQYQVKDYLYLTTSFRSIMLEDTRLPTAFDMRDDTFYLNNLTFGVLIKL